MSLELSSQSASPSRPFAGRILERLLGREAGLVAGSLELTLPDGFVLRRSATAPGPAARIHVKRWGALRRIALGGDVGFAEAFMEGDIDTPDPRAVVAFAIANEDLFSNWLDGHPLARLMGRALHALRANTKRGSRRNIAAHYDLGNSFYRLWLDETMSYSSALFGSESETLADAQRRKYRRIAELAGIKPGMKVLEIGCGWGGFAAYAAGELDCHVTGLTLSAEQRRFALARLADLGLADKVDIRLQDYRDCPGKFDAVVSIEMFEAVGERHWPVYFQRLADRLVAGGRAALQIITIAEQRFETYRRAPDFIQRYIFPGGMLPTENAVVGEAGKAGLAVASIDRFGADYVRTLTEWSRAFREHWPHISAQGFDERFRRMWEYYLDYCAAGFDHGTIDVAHFTLARR